MQDPENEEESPISDEDDSEYVDRVYFTEQTEELL